MPKLRLAASVPAIDWNKQVHRRTPIEAGELGRDVGQAAGLGRDREDVDQPVQAVRGCADDLDRFGGRVDADDRVAAAVEQAVGGREQDAAQVVAGVVGLDPDAQHPALAHRVAAAGDHADLAGGENQVFVAHQLGGGRGDLRNQAGRGGGEVCAVVASSSIHSRNSPTVRLRSGAKASRSSRSRISRLTSSVSGSISGMIDDLLQGEIGQDELGGDPLALRPRRQTRELIARLLLVGLGEDLAQVGEREPLSANDSRKIHAAPRKSTLSVATYRSKFVQGNPPARFTIITKSKAVLILRIRPCC